MHPDVLHWLLAILPVVVVLALMIGLRWGGLRAGVAGWLVTVVVAATFFGAGPMVIGVSQLKGLLQTAHVLYILWMALLLYNVVHEAGAIKVIAGGITRLTGDPMMQLLILGWVFSAFLQGVGGFGVPIAVVAPLLIGLGFAPAMAVIVPAIGHSWSITFGSMASSFVALMAVTGLDDRQLAPWSAAFLGMSCVLVGLAVAHVYEGMRGVAHAFVAVLIIGAFMSVAQYVLAVNGIWAIAGFVSGMVGLGVSAAITRLPTYRRVAKASLSLASTAVANPGSGSPTSMPMRSSVAEPAPVLVREGEAARYRSFASSNEKSAEMSLSLAMLPYVILIVLVVAGVTYGPLKEILNRVTFGFSLPEVTTALGWTTPAGTGGSISVFGHAGAMLVYAAVMGYLVFRYSGRYQPNALRKILANTLRSSVPSSIGIAAMVGIAVLMDYAGMTELLARGISGVVGAYFPILSPLIGLLGAFMTGSNTNSNVIFAPLQKSTAEMMAISVSVILGAQTTGGSLGAMIAPAKIMIGCSTTGLVGKEGAVIRRTLPYAVGITLAVGALAWIAVYQLGVN